MNYVEMTLCNLSYLAYASFDQYELKVKISSILHYASIYFNISLLKAQNNRNLSRAN